MKSVAKAVRILHAFSPATPSLSVRQLAERTELPRATVHALCRTLQDAGMLATGGQGGYRIGPAVTYLSQLSAVGGEEILAAAEPVLASTVRSRGHRAHVAQLADGWVLDLVGRHRIVTRPQRGEIRTLAHRGVAGRAALSPLEAEEALGRVRRACAAEGVAPPEREALLADLAEISRRGCLSADEDELTFVSAPICDRLTGASLGSVTLGLPPTEAGEPAEQLVTVAAARIARRLRR